MWQLKNLIEHCNEVSTEIPEKGIWVPARPIPLKGRSGFKQRAKNAWLVLTGKADAFTWPEGQ